MNTINYNYQSISDCLRISFDDLTNIVSTVLFEQDVRVNRDQNKNIVSIEFTNAKNILGCNLIEYTFGNNSFQCCGEIHREWDVVNLIAETYIHKQFIYTYCEDTDIMYIYLAPLNTKTMYQSISDNDFSIVLNVDINDKYLGVEIFSPSKRLKNWLKDN